MNFLNCIWPQRKSIVHKRPQCAFSVNGHLNEMIVIPNTFHAEPARCLIIGGGVCGLWFAMHLKCICPHFSIDILETAPIEYPQKYIVEISLIEINDYLSWLPTISSHSTIPINDLRSQLEIQMQKVYPDIRIRPTSFDICMEEAVPPYTFVFGADGYDSLFYKKYFYTAREDATSYSYFIQLTYNVEDVPQKLSPEQLSMVKSNIAQMRDIHELCYNQSVILRLELDSTTYILCKTAIRSIQKTAFWSQYHTLRSDARTLLNFWIHARNHFLGEVITVDSPHIDFFEFPRYERRPVCDAHPNFFLIGSSAFQYSLPNDIEHLFHFSAIIALLFCNNRSVIWTEFERKYNDYMRKMHDCDDQRIKITMHLPALTTQDWFGDFMVPMR